MTPDMKRLDEIRADVESCRLAVANEANPALFDHEEVGWLLDQVAALLQEKERLERDAARLDFLEAGGFTTYRSSVRRDLAWVRDCRDGFWDDAITGDSVRAAIDAAMSRGVPSKQEQANG